MDRDLTVHHQLALPATALRRRLLACTVDAAWAHFLHPRLSHAHVGQVRESQTKLCRSFDRFDNQCETSVGDVSSTRDRSATELLSCDLEQRQQLQQHMQMQRCSEDQYMNEWESHVTPRSTGSGAVVGQVWRLSRDPEGCRVVQEHLVADTASALGAELKGHVWEALRCPNANHVLQKAISLAGDSLSRLVIGELLAKDQNAAFHAARHRYGCRVIQRVFEYGSPAQTRILGDALMPKAVSLSTHPFGNYVMQRFLQHGTCDQRHRLCQSFERDIGIVGVDSHGSAVLEKALHHASEDDQLSLERSILKCPGVLVKLACDRHGTVAVQHMMQTLEGSDLFEAQNQLREHGDKLRASRFGRLVLHRLESLDLDCASGGA
uniref:PUM-HD domain-containing protein n=1 Tax=Noctiluca scintillans TaxID=2966 RepID=A0A7S1AGZ2_NOCSC|mmetsp:Transcript_45031/g.119413  ORF Transcript_45031/g.119413 Transcript_45031/m.119413 type:complete len:379 (+) Transcript_45031:50-1186(+)